jgi:hypothetical protein
MKIRGKLIKTGIYFGMRTMGNLRKNYYLSYKRLH